MGRCCIPQALVQERLEQQGPSTVSVPPRPVMLQIPVLSSLTLAGRGLEICFECFKAKHSRGGVRKEAGRNDFSSRLQPLLFLGQDV